MLFTCFGLVVNYAEFPHLLRSFDPVHKYTFLRRSSGDTKIKDAMGEARSTSESDKNPHRVLF